MQWIVGIDLGARSRGALQMAAWMRTQRLPAADEDFVGIHVVDEELRLRFPSDLLRGYMEAVEREVLRVVEETAIASAFTDVRVVMAPSPEDGLTAAATTVGIGGVLIGRVAHRDGRSIQRLGRVARRMLRRLPGPVMVVPPDLPRAEVGTGPVVLATDLGSSAVRAASVASELARALDRELLVLHVQQGPDQTASFAGVEGFVLPPPSPPRDPREVETWSRDNGLASASTRLLDGDVVEAVLAVARTEAAPIIVCGSRRLSLADRIFTSSVGTDLARLADRAVLVVPP